MTINYIPNGYTEFNGVAWGEDLKKLTVALPDGRVVWVHGANTATPIECIVWDANGNITFPSGNAITYRDDQLATAGQTVFNIGYSYVLGTNALEVYVNGLRQRYGTDYTETSATSVTFTSALALNDKVSFFVRLFNASGSILMVTPGQGGTGQDTSSGSLYGTPMIKEGVWYFPDFVVPVTAFGAATTASAATNKTAFDLALANGRPVFVPRGTFDLNALTKLTAPIVMFGVGRDTTLRFNTTGVGIEVEDSTPDQGQTFYLHDLSFDNVTNTPAAFIQNTYPVMSVFERLYFKDCAATFCINNKSGYGTKISDCSFADITGGAIKLQQNAGLTTYSYAASIRNCDITRVSGNGIEIDGSSAMVIDGGVIESCAKGIYINPVGASVQAWGINVIGTHFESNTVDIDCNTSSSYKANLTLNGVHLPSGSHINLGDYGRLVVIHSNSGGPAWCEINGGSEARVILVNTIEHNYVKHASFTGQWLDLADWYDADDTITFYTNGVGTSAGTGGVLTGRWRRLGSRAELSIYLKLGTGLSLTPGAITFRSALMDLLPALDYTHVTGNTFYYDNSSGQVRTGGIWIDSDGKTILLNYNDGSYGQVSTSVPWTWDSDDQIRLTLTYRVSST